MSETHLSREAYERLRAELEDLTTRGRVDIAQTIETARELGDLSENGDYHAAKEEQGKMEARIRQLEEMLRNAQVGDAPSGDAVAAGMVVTTVDEDGNSDTFLLGSREDRPEGLHVVSANSPLGQALVGAKIGETRSYEAPAGEFKVTVTAIRPHE